LGNENSLPALGPKSLLLSMIKEKGTVLKRFDANQLLAAAVLAAAIVLILLLKKI
jgi:hypothetical protein